MHELQSKCTSTVYTGGEEADARSAEVVVSVYNSMDLCGGSAVIVAIAGSEHSRRFGHLERGPTHTQLPAQVSPTNQWVWRPLIDPHHLMRCKSSVSNPRIE